MKKKNEKKLELNRREFVATAATSLLSFYGGNLFAASPNSDHRLVVVFLRGAADGLSILPPRFASSGDSLIYRQLRAGQVVQNPLSMGASDPFQLHPALQPLLQAVPTLSFVAGVGSLNNSRSHFEQMDIIESGKNRPGPEGYLNRVLKTLAGPKSRHLPSVSLNSTIPLALRGSQPSFPISSTQLHTGVGNAEYRTLTDASEKANALWKDTVRRNAIKSDNVLAPVGRRLELGVEGVRRAQEASLTNISSSAAYGDEKFRAAARLINSDRKIRLMTVDVGGWDDHVNIGVNGGKFHNRLAKLSTALGSFCRDLKAMGEWHRTTVVVMTEFGRRVALNGSDGFDHGRGGVMMVMGGQVLARRQIQRDYDLSRLDQGDVRVTIDYRDVFTEILRKNMNLTDAQLQEVFPGYSGRSIRLIKS